MPNIALRYFTRAVPVALGLAAGAAWADPPHAWAAARTFRDWRLDCGGDACEITSALRGADGSMVLAVAASGRGAAGALVLRTPLPLFLPDGLTLALGDAPPRPVMWRTCGPGGCAAEAPLGADLLAALQRERSVEVTLTLEDGVRVRLPLSLLGFTAAWDALAVRGPAAAPVTRP